MEKRGVVVEVKNVIAIESIPIIEEEDESMDIDVEEAMDMSIVEVAADAMVVVMLMPDMSMLDISILKVLVRCCEMTLLFETKL